MDEDDDESESDSSSDDDEDEEGVAGQSDQAPQSKKPILQVREFGYWMAEFSLEPSNLKVQSSGFRAKVDLYIMYGV